MKLKTCILTHSSCYLAKKRMTNDKPAGIVVHSTGANNKTIKRYVQPVKGDANYDEAIADLGTNTYNNHWNMAGKNVCVHAVIGTNKAGEIETYQILPFNYCCWGCASGKNGSYNYNPNARIQFEICEDNLKDEVYFNKVMKEAQEFCAYLCKQYNLTVDKICSHYEAYYAGYGSNHGDPDHWLKKFGKDMNWFRGEVQKLLGTVPAFVPYLVRVVPSGLNIRSGPGTDNSVVGVIRDCGTYTIVEEALGKGASKWGKLKSGKGWISLDFCVKK